jgi:hypothetical protein
MRCTLVSEMGLGNETKQLLMPRRITPKSSQLLTPRPLMIWNGPPLGDALKWHESRTRCDIVSNRETCLRESSNIVMRFDSSTRPAKRQTLDNVRIQLQQRLVCCQNQRKRSGKHTVPCKKKETGPALGLFSASFSILIASISKRSICIR